MSGQLTFGSWLRQRRTELGITRDELSERLGFSLDMLRKLESGERRPSGQIAHILADYFRIPSDEHDAFVTFARTGGITSPPAGVASDARAISLIAPWRRVYVHQTNLPSMLTLFIGRERETATVRDLILQPKTRLLTLTGPPGIGKTRLGLQAASELVGHFEDGVFFVDLAPIVNPDLVLATIARALGLKEDANRSSEDVLLDFVRERRMMLLLDNFEQVLDAAIYIVRIMQASPWLKAIVTSREALHVRGEKRLPVPPLDLPPLRQDPDGLPAMDLLATYPSVELFVERAQAVAPDFKLTAGNARDVADVCIGVEGLPLAIELAAARADHLSPLEMRKDLSSRLKLLAGGARDLPPRQRTLRSAIEWSYILLNKQEQILFRRLGVFVGGFELEAVGAICMTDESHVAGSTRGLLLSLVDKSLVKQESMAGVDSNERFSMLESIREFAFEKLYGDGQQADAVEMERRHGLYFMHLAEQAEPHLAGREQVRWLDTLERDYDNIRAALRWAKEANSPDEAMVGLRIAGSLPRFWYKRGFMNEGREQLAAVLTSSPQSSELRPYRAVALISAGILAHLHGDYTSARSLYEECLAIQRDLGDKKGVAEALSQLAQALGEQGESDTAISLHEEALAVRREIGDPAGIASSLGHLGVSAWEKGDNITARSFLEESLAIRLELGDKRGIATMLGNLGTLAHEERDYAAARSLFQEVLAIWKDFGDKPMMSHAISSLASVASDEGNYDDAYSLHRESLIIRWNAHSMIHVLNDLVGIGRLAVRTGEAARGTSMLGATDGLWEKMGIAPEPDFRTQYEEGVALARTQLQEEEFLAAWSQGRSMSIEQAVEYALKERL